MYSVTLHHCHASWDSHLWCFIFHQDAFGTQWGGKMKQNRFSGFLLRQLHAHRLKPDETRCGDRQTGGQRASRHQALTFRDTVTVQQTGVSVNVILWAEEKKRRATRAEAAQEKQFVSVRWEKKQTGSGVNQDSAGQWIIKSTRETQERRDRDVSLHLLYDRKENQELDWESLTSWTRPVGQNLHAGDPRQLHLEVAFTVQEQIPGVRLLKTKDNFDPHPKQMKWF